MRLRHRPLLGLLASVLFVANSIMPGLLHRCDGDRPATTAEVAASPHHHMAGMPGMGGMAGDEHQSSAPPSTPFGDCHCIGHSCGSVAPALPASGFVLAVTTAPLPGRAELPGSTAPILRVAHILPFAQAPPLA